MKTWWQVYLFNDEKDKIEVFGFSSSNNIVTDPPLNYHYFRNKTLQEIKPWLLSRKAQVVKICDQN